jgi:hypothetical protein
MSPPERRERGDPCWLLKLKQLGTQGVHMKGVLPWLFVGLVVPVKENFVLPWLLKSAQYKVFFPSLYTISLHLSPPPSKQDRQSCHVAYLFIYVFGLHPPHPLGRHGVRCKVFGLYKQISQEKKCANFFKLILKKVQGLVASSERYKTKAHGIVGAYHSKYRLLFHTGRH